jgi:hypothetical protein
LIYVSRLVTGRVRGISLAGICASDSSAGNFQAMNLARGRPCRSNRAAEKLNLLSKAQ